MTKVTDYANVPYRDFRMPETLRFGVHAAKSLLDEVNKLHPQKIAIISDKGLEMTGLVNKIANMLKPLSIPMITFTEIRGEPTFALLQNCIKTLQQEACDLIIGIGGGSAMDVAKATAALLNKESISDYLAGISPIEERSVRCILLPTTSGTGAEVTMNAIFGDEEQEVKRGLVSAKLLPDLAIIDPALTLSCPPRVTAASGVDAFTHAIESYVAVRATPLTRIYAEEAMRLFPGNIVRAVHNGQDLDARVGMSWVSMLAGVSLANAGVGAVHALAYPLGGKFHIEHGVANALLMPFVFEVTGTTCMEQMVSVAELLQIGHYKEQPRKALEAVVQYLYELLGKLDLPTSLEQLGIDEDSLRGLAEQAVKIDRLLSNTPYKLTETKILHIYQKAFKGF